MSERRKGIVKKLNIIYKMGYLPSRGKTKYSLANERVVNCFGHACFNLNNSTLKQLDCSKDELKDFFRNFGGGNVRNFFEGAKEKLSQVGLICERSYVGEKLQKNQWKVAYYILNDEFRGRDLHFMIQEKNGCWTSKLGTSSNIEVYEELPQEFKNGYQLAGIYKITNPYVKVKDEGMER